MPDLHCLVQAMVEPAEIGESTATNERAAEAESTIPQERAQAGESTIVL
jgi:hypothetical protein